MSLQKKHIWTAAKIVIACALLVVAFYINREHISQILAGKFKIGYLALGFLTPVFIFLIGALRWAMILKTQKTPLSFTNSLKLTMIGSFFNMIVHAGATGGDIIKAYYVARIFPEKKTATITTVFFDRGIGIFTLLLMAGASFPFSAKHIWNIPELRIVIIILFSLIAASFLFIFVAFSRKTGSSAAIKSLAAKLPFSKTLKQIYNTLYSYRAHPGLLLSAILLSALAHGFNMLGNYFFLLAMDIHVDFALFMFLVPIALFIGCLPISPLGLGVGEMAYSLMFGLGGFGECGPGAGTLTAALMHISLMLWGFTGAIFYIKGRDLIEKAIADAESDTLSS